MQYPEARCSLGSMQVQHQLVWVWPEAGPNAHLEAMSREATVIPELLDENIAAYAVPWSACFPVCVIVAACCSEHMQAWHSTPA